MKCFDKEYKKAVHLLQLEIILDQPRCSSCAGKESGVIEDAKFFAHSLNFDWLLSHHACLSEATLETVLEDEALKEIQGLGS